MQVHKLLWMITALTVTGCARTGRLAELQQPPRPAMLDAYDVFVGQWDWEAQVVGAEGPDSKWTGSASWDWTLDRHFLQGTMTSRSGTTAFSASGMWSWHPTRRQYVWWMFNNWGYPQEGTARYDAHERHWTMPYTSVGLDGSTSYGRYDMRVLDDRTLDWRMVEWADALHLIKKVEMAGRYHRRR